MSVVFADAVGSTEQAARSSPEEFADALDELFRRFDQIADRHGLEKIKTIGDAYMAVAGRAGAHGRSRRGGGRDGARDPRRGGARFGGRPATRSWCGSGVATGPAVAGIIGNRKFAYDLWGDTVNLASRLQESAEPGQVLVSESTAEQLDRSVRVRAARRSWI